MKPRSFTDCPESKSYVDVYPNCTDFDGGAQVSSTYLPIGLNSSEASDVIADLKTSGTWVNFDTLQLGVKVVTYNAEGDKGSGGFTVTKLDVSFAESGPEALELKASITSVPDFRGTRRWVLLCTMGTLGLVFVRGLWILERIVGTASPAEHGESFCDYFLDSFPFIIKFGAIPGFIIPWVKVTTTDFSSTVEALADSTVQSTQERIDALEAAIAEFDASARWMEALSILGALAVGQLGLYVIRQLRFHPQLNVFARTIGSALHQFVSFFVVFMIIFLTFSFAGNVLFGHRVRQFSTGLYAMQTCINMLFGEFDYGCISDIRGSGFFYWGYMLVLTIVLLNMMLAIVTSTYEDMSNDGVKGEISVLLTTRISWIPRNMVTPLGPKHPSLTRPSEDDKKGCADFDRYEIDLRKLEHKDVVLYGKIRPLLLSRIVPDKWKLLCETAKTKSGDPSAVCTVPLTPAILREMLPAAEISDAEMRATFKFLHEGLILYKAVTRRHIPKRSLQAETGSGERVDPPAYQDAPSSKPEPNAVPTVETRQGEKVDASTESSEVQQAKTNSNEIADAHVNSSAMCKLQEETAAGLEHKLDMLLEAVLLSQTATG